MNSASNLAAGFEALRKPHPVARASTIRQAIAAAEKYLLTLDDPKARAEQREHIELLRLALRAAR